METPQNFRSAFNGFNREDVVQYLEYLNAKYTTQINQLNTEAEELRTQLADRDSAPVEAAEASSEELETLREQLEQSEAANQELSQRCTDLEDSCKELEAHCKELEQKLNQSGSPAADSSLAGRELEAYRRAERAERDAKERADVIYHRTNGILADASTRVDSAATQVGAMADNVLAQLLQLQACITDSKKALQEASSIMYSLRPESDGK